MKTQKRSLTILIMSTVLLIGTIGIFIYMSNIDNLSEDNITYYSATVESTRIENIGEKVYVAIQTKEYATVLHISQNIGKELDMDDVYNLKNGQTVLFRVENTKTYLMDNADIIDIVSLQTESNTIFSLEDYNKYIHISAQPARTLSIVVAFLFLILSVSSFLSMKQNHR